MAEFALLSTSYNDANKNYWDIGQGKENYENENFNLMRHPVWFFF
jgi:hypothetical protein